MLTESQSFSCPWCGEPNWVELEPGDLGQTVIQDCAVCCRAIEIFLPDEPEQPVRIVADQD